MEDMVYSFSSAGRMGEWHEGNKFDIRTAVLAVDPYPNDFKTKVEVRNRVTGEIKQYSGRGKFIGNFSPIWIRFGGKSLQLTEILRME